jgi:hypothetical protein
MSSFKSLSNSQTSTGEIFHVAKLAYYGICATAFVIGAGKGVCKWYQWRKTRKYRKINNDMLEPIVNITCDVGKLAYNAGVAGVASTIVAGTAPVSVPFLLYVCEHKKEKTDDDDKKLAA